MTRVLFSYVDDLTDPNAASTPIGTLLLDGTTFVSFTWDVDVSFFGDHPLVKVVVAAYPDFLRVLVAHASDEDPASFVARTCSHTNLYVSEVIT